MASRGHQPTSYEGRSMQAPGMMRHGPAPPHGSSSHRSLETLRPPTEVLENKVAVQGAEMDRLVRENQKLAATHGALREEILIAQQETQRIRAHVGRVQTESNIQIRGILDKISKMEADIRSADSIKKELQQAHMAAQSLVGARQEHALQIQQATMELHRIRADINKLPEMNFELEALMQDHQNLRDTFEREKGSNLELVQKMQGMESNLQTMSREVEKLRAEIQNAEKKVQQAPNPYQNGNSAYQNVGQQPNPYTDNSYAQGMTYANGGYAQVGSYPTANYVPGATNNYVGSYGNTQVHTNGSVVDPYGRTQVQTSGTIVDPYGRTQVQTNSATEVTNPYGVGNAAVAYDTTVAVASVPATYDPSRSGIGAVSTFDPARAGMGVGVATYDAARGNPVNNVAPQYDPARAVVNGPGLPYEYDPSKAAGMNGPGAYDASAARGAQSSIQR